MISFILAALLSAAAFSQESHLLDLESVRTKAIEALGRTPLQNQRGWKLEGETMLLGEKADYSLIVSSEGRFLETIESQRSRIVGYNGESIWEIGIGKTPRILELGDREQFLTNYSFLVGNLWDDQRGLLQECHLDEGSNSIVVTFLNGRVGGTVTVDESTGMPSSIQTLEFGDGSVEFLEMANHETFGAYPKRFNRNLDIASGLVSIRSISEIDTPPWWFEPKLDGATDFGYDESIEPELTVIRAASGHLLVRPTLDDEDLGWFIFDSGAGMSCIDIEVAKGFGLRSFGVVQAQGVGGAVPSSFWTVDSLQLGPVEIDSPIMVGLDLKSIGRGINMEIGGILGFDFIARSTIEIDMLQGEIRLFNPDTYDSDARWEDLILYTKHPCVHASFEDHRGVFRIDTGAASSTVSFHTPFVESHRLLEGRKTEPSSAGGIGGQVKLEKGQVAWFELAGHRFENPEVEFSKGSIGAFADPYTMGNLGGGFLEPFVLVLDYSHKRVGFKPRDP